MKRDSSHLYSIPFHLLRLRTHTLRHPYSYLPIIVHIYIYIHAIYAVYTIHAIHHTPPHTTVSVEEGCEVLVTPPANRGKSAMVTITSSRTTGVLQFEFQRQKYFYTPASRLGAAGAKEFPHGVFSLSTCPIDMPLSHYTAAKGILTGKTNRQVFFSDDITHIHDLILTM